MKLLQSPGSGQRQSPAVAASPSRRFSPGAAFLGAGVALTAAWGTLVLAMWDGEKNSLGEDNQVPWGWVLYLVVWLMMPTAGLVLAANPGSPRRRGTGLGLTFVWWGAVLFFCLALVMWLGVDKIDVDADELLPQRG